MTDLYSIIAQLQETVLADMKQLGEVMQIIKSMQDRIHRMNEKLNSIEASIKYPISRN